MKSKIEKLLKAKKEFVNLKPQILNLLNSGDRSALKGLFAKSLPRFVIDDYEEQQRELFAVKNPSLVYTADLEKSFVAYYGSLQKKGLWGQGRWVYYPWLSSIVHVLKDDDFQLVRMARNRNLINEAEQNKFYNSVIGIGGLSVGNSVALAIVLQGGARHIRIADHDRLALSNINRIRAGVQNLGLSKTEITARQIYEINPYAKVEIFSDGLTSQNIKKFFTGPPKLDVVIDELDNLAVKFLIREQAKKHRIPVVMAADNGDNGVVDVERYDLNSKTEYFHGRMGKVTYKELSDLNKFGIGKLIVKHIGPETVTGRVQESMPQIGKTIVSWPQLGGAALLNGSAVAYCVRKILNKQSLEGNRALVSLDEKLVPGYDSAAQRRRREKAAKKFRDIFGL